MDELRFRQIHLDFHTNENIENVGADFDPKDFAETLVKANVDSITCFARCHHGMLYYESKSNPERVHPHLARSNLLGEQIEACHSAGIRAPIYTTVQWDAYTAIRHRDWLCRDERGSSFGEAGQAPQLPLEPGFYDVLCVNSPYRDFLKAHVKELIETFNPIDGIFLDIVFPVPCCCPSCIEGMQKAGLSAHIEADRMRFGQQSVDDFKRDMTAWIRKFSSDCTIFYNRGHVGTPHRSAKDSYTHFELETLPSGAWGYLHFPATIRYARNLGKDCMAHTGKFHTMWGDFHSFKNRAALEFECFNILAQGAKCLIGDQMEPSGKLSQPVYELIGGVYESVKAKEPWCRETVAVTEIGVLTPEEFFGATVGVLPEALRGAVRMLQESSLQFDVLDSQSDFTPYKLIILPDVIPVSDTLSQKLKLYIQQGGKIIGTFESVGDGSLFDVAVRQNQPVDLRGEPVKGRVFDRGDYCDYILPKDGFCPGLPRTEHVMYIKGLEVDALPDSTVLADAVASVFPREYRHYCSHRQSPSSEVKSFDAIVQNSQGNCIYLAHPVFTQYNYNAPLWCKKLLTAAVDLLLGGRMITHDAPSTMLSSLLLQQKQNRLVLHLLHYIPERRSQTIDIIEDVIPLYKVSVNVKTAKPVKNVMCVPDATPLPFNCEDGIASFTVPEINGHQMIALEY